MSWYNNNWKYRKKITINSSLVTASLTNFTFALKRTDSSLAESAKSNGSDIIFTDINNQLLDFEIIKFNKSTGELIANVKLNVSNTQNTEFYMYFGNSIDTNINLQNKSNANARFSFVSHLAFDPTLSTIPLDKGPYTNLTKYGTWLEEEDSKLQFEDSPLGYGLNFNQLNNQFFSSEKLDFTGAQTFSIEAWINRNTTEDDRIIAQGYLTDPATQDFNFGIQGSKLMARLRTDLTASASRFGNTNITLNQWNHVAFIWKANTNSLKIILNGNDDGAFIVNGNSVDCLYQRQFPSFVKTFIANADESNDRKYSGGMSEVRISTDNGYTEEYIKLHYRNVTNSNFYTTGEKEVVSGLLLGENQWRSDYIDYLKRIKVHIKKEEIIGTEQYTRFPFLLNLYTPCLNEANPFANDIVITDESGERLPFERMLFRQNVNQQRYAAAYEVDYFGQAQQVYDVNAEGTYRAGYLTGAGNYIRFRNVQILNQGTHNLVIRYSNGSGATQNVDIRVNGVTYMVNMPVTGSWSTYSTVSVPINWTQKWNEIEIGRNSTSPDIDYIQPLGQETAQLKGFVLLPELKSSVDTEIHIYFKNPTAPIRLNPAHGQPEQVVQAETMTRVSNFQIETNSMYSNGSGLRLSSTASVGVATTIFNGVSGFYDIAIETISENDGLSGYSIRINGVLQKIFSTKQVTTDNTRTNHLRRRIWINNGDTIEIRSNSSTTSCFGRFGLLRIMPTIMDPNTNWNSEEVWGDYEAVWHLDGTPGENRPFYDYSGKERHLFSYNMSAGVNKVQSSIGVGVNFFDNNDILYGQFDSMNLQNNNFTISAWLQRSTLLNENRGILITDDLWWRFERTDRIRLTYGNSGAGDSQYFSSDFAVQDRFLYYTNNFVSSTGRRRARLNGNGLYNRTFASNFTGLNNSITLGVSRNQHNIYASDTETFRGLIAEVRISKIWRSENWERNEYKNSMFPQQYINYDTMFCEENRQDFEIIIDPNGMIVTTTPSNQALYVIPRNMSGQASTSGQQLFASLHFEREMIGEITITSDDHYGEFVLIRDMTGGLTTETNTTAGINWTIEFVRFFTGGILSGDVDVNPESNYIPDTEGSVSFGYINTSHTIDNGFTLEVIFHDAIGGSGFTSGAIVNNITRYTNVEIGGITWTGGTDVDERECHYNEIENVGSFSITGSIVDLFEIHCLLETDFAYIQISGTNQNTHKVIYNEIENTGKIELSVEIEYYHELHINEDVLVSSILVDSDKTIFNVNYVEIDNVGKINLSGDILNNTETTLIQLSDFAYCFLSGNIANFTNTNYHNIVSVNSIKLRGTSQNEFIVFKPIPTGTINLIEGVFEPDIAIFITDVGGIFNIGVVDTSIEIGTDQELHVVLTSIGGKIITNLSSIREIDYNNITSNGLITTNLSSIREIDYNNITSNGLIIGNGSSVNYSSYINIISGGSFNIFGYGTNVSLHIKYTENIGGVLTTSLEDSVVSYVKQVFGKIEINGSGNEEFIGYEDAIGTIILSGISQTNNISIFIPEVSGIINVSGDADFNSSYRYEIFNPEIKTSGNAIDDFIVEVLFDNILEIQTFGNAWNNLQVHNIYIEEFNGGIKLKDGSLVVIYSSVLVPHTQCVKGRVATTGQLPSMQQSSLGDIYYVETNHLSNWWQFIETNNYVPRPDPYFNTGISGVYNTFATLPATAPIGTTYQVGKCHDGIFYTYTASGWELAPYYPPQIHISRVSIGVFRTSGSANIETNYTTTDIEVSGEINVFGEFRKWANYNSTLIGGSLFTDGSYDDFLVSANNIGNGLIELSGDPITPLIDRINDEAVYAYFDGSADSETDYIQDTPIYFFELVGSAGKRVDHNPDLSFDRVIQLSGEVLESDRVDIIYRVSGGISLSGSVSADNNDYNITSITGSLITLTSKVISYVIYAESNESIQIIISGSFNKLLILNPISLVTAELTGEIDADESNFIKETLGFINTNLSSEIQSHYMPEVSGGITWLKNTTANLIVVGETLVAYFTPYGGLNFFAFYLNVNCVYNDDNTTGLININGSFKTEQTFDNPEHESGKISVFGSFGIDKNEYVDESILQIIFNGIVEENVVYNDDTTILKLKIEDYTENKIVYTPQTTGKVLLIGYNQNDIINEYYVGDIERKIIVSGETTRILLIPEATNEVPRIIISGNVIPNVRFNAVASITRLIITSGVSAPNNVHTITRPLGRKIQTSGACSRSVEFRKNIINPRIFTLGSALVYVTYLEKEILTINTSGTGPYRFVIYRNFNGGINFFGGIDSITSRFDLRYIVSGGIKTSGSAIYKQSHNFTIRNLGILRIQTSGSANYIHERNHIYNVSGGIKTSGGTTDPTEFYLTIAGQLNVFGRAQIRANYNYIVETETIKLSLDGYTEYTQLHNFYPQVIKTSIILYNDDVEYDVIKNYLGEVEEEIIIISGDFEYYDILDYEYDGYGNIQTSGNSNQFRIYNHIATQDELEIIISGESVYYQEFNKHEVSGGIITSGIDITLDAFECIYKPRSGGIVWSKGTIVDPTNYNEYIKEDFDGSIKTKVLSIRRFSRIFYYTATHSHLGSIVVSGWAGTKPELKSIIEVAKIIVHNPEDIAYQIGYTQRRIRPTIRIIVKGKFETNGVHFYFNGNGLIKTKVSSVNKLDVKPILSETNKIILSGTELPKISVSRTMFGSILINGIAGGNVSILPEVNGWLITGGGIGSADFVNYGELDYETLYLRVISRTLYRTHDDLLLEFREITRRREFEAGIGDDETSYPEDTWSVLQNFNDMLEKQ